MGLGGEFQGSPPPPYETLTRSLHLSPSPELLQHHPSQCPSLPHQVENLDALASDQKGIVTLIVTFGNCHNHEEWVTDDGEMCEGGDEGRESHDPTSDEGSGGVTCPDIGPYQA